MKTEISHVCGKQIQHDNSGVGHNWRNIAAQDIPADIREEIDGEITVFLSGITKHRGGRRSRQSIDVNLWAECISPTAN